MKVYPNPSNGIFNIETGFDCSELIITDLNGKVVYSDENPATNFSIDLQKLPQGMYILRTGTDDYISAIKKISIIK